MILIFKVKQQVAFKIYRILKNIYGLGFSKINTLLIRLGANLRTDLFNLKKFRGIRLSSKLLIISKFCLEEILKLREVEVHYFRVKIGAYKGIKLYLGLPLNGQKTKTNAKTAKRLTKNNKGLSKLVKNKISYENRKEKQLLKRKK